MIDLPAEKEREGALNLYPDTELLAKADHRLICSHS